MQPVDDLSYARIAEYIDYNPETGILKWIKKKGNATFVGKVCNGKMYLRGEIAYVGVYLDGRHYGAHRLAWTLYYGQPPNGFIDHKNGNGLDNKIGNLRCVTAGGNSRNQKVRKNNKSGVMGVRWNDTKSGEPKWEARIGVAGGKVRLGFFDSMFDAVCARKSAEIRRDYHENHGRQP